MTLVIDASIAVAWLFPDQHTTVSRHVLERVGGEGAHAPTLWKLEVANVLWGAIRRKRCDEKFASESLDLLTRLQITIDQETEDHAWGKTRSLASEFDLTIYDATYLELAIRKRAVLATLDAKLAAAGRRAGLEVLID